MRDADWTNAHGVRVLKEALGDQADLYEPRLWRPASEIDVDHLRLILTWPLVLAPSPEAARDGERRASISRLAKTLREDGTPAWQEIPDLMDHAPHDDRIAPWLPKIKQANNNDAQIYGEFVYFFDFIQRHMLAGPPQSNKREGRPEKGIHLFRRTDIKKLCFQLEADKPNSLHSAAVTRFNLYLLDIGVAVVAVEIDFGYHVDRSIHDRADVQRHRLTLADAQTIIDRLRRAYTPYFFTNTDGGVVSPGAVVAGLDWLDADGLPIPLPPGASTPSAPPLDTASGAIARDAFRFRPRSLKDDLKTTKAEPTVVAEGGRTPPVADHWRAALHPLVFSGYANAMDDVVFRQILDERIPVLSFVSLTGAAARKGTPINLDGYWTWDSNGGHSAAAQYTDLQLVSRGDWMRLCFADGKGSAPLPYSPHFLKSFEADYCYDRFYPSKTTNSATRIMTSGYHVSMVGAGGFFDETLIHHFRRHYFQMVLLANIEFAGLLATSSRISTAIDALAKSVNQQEGEQRFRKSLELIEKDFLKFIHRYRFTGVSNQIQPTELFELLRKTMRLNGLFEDVKAEIEAAVTFNNSLEQERIVRSTYRLTEVATVAAALGIGFTFLSITEVGELLQAINPFAGGELKGRLATAFGYVETGGDALSGTTGTPPSSVTQGAGASKGPDARGFIPLLSLVLAGVVYVACSFAMRILGTDIDANDAGRLSVRGWLPQLKGMALLVMIGMVTVTFLLAISPARP